MRIPKSHLIEQFLAEGDVERAERADRELPDEIDPTADADTLQSLGIDPTLLLTSAANLEDRVRGPDD